MLSFDTSLSNALKNANTTAFWVLKLYYNDESNFIGVSDRHRQDGTDIYYGIVASFGTLRQSLDFFNFTTSIGNMSVTLINSDDSIKGGRFTDLLSTNNFANRKWELFLNTNETSTLDTAARMIGTGVISGEIDFDRNNTTLTLLDNSSRYHKQVPINVVDSSTYPNAPENNIGKPIPIAYGDFYEKTDVGTIPTSHFDRFSNFYKGAFPAIVTDKWDVGEAASEAKVDSQALHTLDSENLYFFKNGFFPTFTGTCDATTNNPVVEFSGGTASVYIPLSSSGQGSGTITNSGSVSNPTNAVDGSFSTVATIAANGATTADSAATISYAIPKVNKLGDFTGISSLVKWGTVSSLTDTVDDFFQLAGVVTLPSITSNSEVKYNIEGMFTSAQEESFDFEKNISFKLFSGNQNESVQIAETGAVIDFNIEDIDKHELTELIEVTPAQTVVDKFGNTLTVKNALNVVRTDTLLSPVKLDFIYYSGKGRKYGAYIDADSRNQGYNENDLIENPIFIIEDILRDELSMSSSNIDFATFDTSGNTSNGHLGDIYEDAVGDVKFAFSQYKFINSKSLIDRLAKFCLSYIFISGDGKFKIKTLRRTDDYSASNQTINYNDLTNVKIAKTNLDAIRNDIKIKYNYNYGAQQNKLEATATDSTSQGTTVNGFNQTLKLELEANEILDDTTATKLAEAYLIIMKSRKEKINFSTTRPKYNHLEIGDIVDFSNWPSKFKVYGATLSGYFMITDISKNINSSNIEVIKVS